MMKTRTALRQFIIPGAIVFLGLTAVLTVVLEQGFGLGSMVAAGGSTSDTVTRTLSHNYGTWSYQASQLAGGAVNVGIHYDESSVAALYAFASANQELAKQLATQGGQAQIRITFRNYVDPTRFRAWAKTIGLQVHDSTLGAIDTKGYAVGFGIATLGTDVLPQVGIDRSITELGRPSRGGTGPITPPLTVQGVYETTGNISAQALLALSSDPLVFVADVTVNVVQKDLRAAGMPAPDLSEFGEDSFWGSMLRLGLARSSYR